MKMRNSLLALALLAWGSVGAANAQEARMTPRGLQQALAAGPVGDDAKGMADKLRAYFGADDLKKGAKVKTEGLTAAWAIEAPGATRPPRVVSLSGSALYKPLQRIGDTDVYAASVDLPDGAGMRYAYDVDGKRVSEGQLEVYTTPPDNQPNPNVPKGVLTQQTPWHSTIYPDTVRDWWIYVPAQYKADTPACVMIFQDGGGYTGIVPTVFDNLIAKGEMPVTVAIFINPGTPVGGGPSNQRSIEYDTLSNRYSRYLLEEILPEAEKTVKLRHDAASRAIAGISSGGICAFTAAWERPDQFSKVLSWVGSFTNIANGPTMREGGHNYEALVRKTPPKPIRVFLQDGENDLDNANGNWPLANQTLAKSLAFASYDYKFVYGHGFHSPNHGRAVLPDSLRWLWRGYQPN